MIRAVAENQEFDATLWFLQASDEQILHLRSMNYHVYCAVLRGEDYELHVDPEEAEAWIAAERPHLV
jgi:hypothetical protein